MQYQQCPFATRGVESDCPYVQATILPPQYLTLCCFVEIMSARVPNDGYVVVGMPRREGNELFPIYSSSSSEMDSNDEVLPWLLLLLLDPPPADRAGDGSAFWSNIKFA